jgi:uncharacterized membrane protein YfcA
MGFLVIIPFAALACFGIVGIFRWLRRGNYGREWWKAFTILALVGLALGVFFSFFLEYKIANKRIAGFPIPVAISTLENGNWTREVLPASLRYPGLLTDLLSGIALCLVPIAVAAFFKENRGQKDSSGKPLV